MLIRSSKEQFIRTETLEKNIYCLILKSEFRNQKGCQVSYLPVGHCMASAQGLTLSKQALPWHMPMVRSTSWAGPTAPHLWSPMRSPPPSHPVSHLWLCLEFQLWSLISQHHLEKKHCPICWMGKKFTQMSPRDTWKTQQNGFMKLGSKHQRQMSYSTFKIFFVVVVAICCLYYLDYSYKQSQRRTEEGRGKERQKEVS